MKDTPSNHGDKAPARLKKVGSKSTTTKQIRKDDGNFSQALVPFIRCNKNEDLMIENNYYQLVSNDDLLLRTANSGK